MLFCHLLIFLEINIFEKKNPKCHQSVKHFWIQIRPDVLSGLIWIQTVCKGYQQTTVLGKEIIVKCFIVNTLLFINSRSGDSSSLIQKKKKHRKRKSK